MKAADEDDTRPLVANKVAINRDFIPFSSFFPSKVPSYFIFLFLRSPLDLGIDMESGSDDRQNTCYTLQDARLWHTQDTLYK
jgi:hypothetical protein